MRNPGIIRIAAVFWGTLFLAGCHKTDDPASEQTSIRFEAGSLLLKDDAQTKTLASLKTGTTFGDTDKIAVFGYHSGNSEWVFERQEVTHEYAPTATPARDCWTYSPGKPWVWHDANDYYDFIAVYPYEKTSGYSKTATASETKVVIPYSPSNPCDLMAAAVHRSGGTTNSVHFQFPHLLSAVKVIVEMDTDSKAFTLTSYRFRNLPRASGSVCISINNGVVSTPTWENVSTLPGDQFGQTGLTEYLYYNSAQDNNVTFEGGYDLMIPQTFTSNSAVLVLNCTYTNDQSQVVSLSPAPAIPLRTINKKNTSTPITQWEAGKVYVYEIKIRIGGGVVVNVSTTDWEDFNAQTPGLQI